VAEAGQLPGLRREGEAEQPAAEDGERRQEGEGEKAPRGVCGSGEDAAPPRRRGAQGDPDEPGREAHADRGLVAGRVHDELPEQEHLCRGGEEAGGEEGGVPHEAVYSAHDRHSRGPSQGRRGASC
jgi:hypothetical protein